MKKVEADTLEEAYQKAAILLECSITELQYEVIQYPSRGILGLLKKKAIIVASCKIQKSKETSQENTTAIQNEISNLSIQEEVAKDIVESIQKDNDVKKVQNVVIDNFFSSDNQNIEQEKVQDSEEQIDKELSLLIEKELKSLIEISCFDIDVIEVDVINNIAYIFIDGEDSALLIGKEGYRYNALSYMIFNWLNSKYDLYMKLEIAEFITSQRDMIKNYIKPIIEQVNLKGRAKTRFLDGILVQLALEELRKEFPNKYVAIKTAKSGKKFVVINDFNSKPND
jgi:spoIIIJ-associated protein